MDSDEVKRRCNDLGGYYDSEHEMCLIPKSKFERLMEDVELD